MKIYVDLVILLNFFIDFLLLLSVSLLNKKNASIIRLILASFIGGISIISLFVPFNSITLFLFKLFISIIMILVSFPFKTFKEFFSNLFYLYIVSIILGGFLYYLNNELSYKNMGLIFFHNGFSINWIIIVISSPILLYLYVKNQRSYKENYANKYEVEITFLNNKKANITGFLDSGNNLYDPYYKRPIILISKSIIGNYKPKCILVPCYTVNKESMIKCFRIKKIIINGKTIDNNVLVGISDNNFNLDGVECLLHKKIMEGLI